MRWLFWLFGLCLSVTIIAPIALWCFFDINQYKPELLNLLTEKTGISLTVQGPLELHLFPMPTLTLHTVSSPMLRDLQANTLTLHAPWQTLWNQHKAHLFIDSLTYKNVPIQKLRATLQYTPETVTLNDITATLCEGTLAAHITHHRHSTTPLSLQGTLSQVALQPLLTHLQQKPLLSGRTNMTFDLTHHRTQGLQGVVKANITQGTIQGVDIPYYVHQANTLFKKNPVTKNNARLTPFDSLQATLQVRNNILHNNDLLLSTPAITTRGKGLLDLGHKTLTYQLQAQGADYPLKGIPLAIRLTGPLHHPNIVPDLDVYLKILRKKDVQAKLKTKLERKIDHILTTEHTETEDVPEKKKRKRKIEQKLAKNLQKLLKYVDTE